LQIFFFAKEITEFSLRYLSQLNALVHFVYTYTPIHFQMIKHTSRGEREGDTMSERGRGIQSEGERVVAIRERYGGEYRETR